MSYFGQFYLDKEKDIIVDLYLEKEEMSYVLRTPNHGTGNLITNLALMCGLPLSFDEQGFKIIKGTVPCYIDAENRKVYIFRLRDTKVANIYPDGQIETKASIPAISKTLMSQTKDYRLDFAKTVVKTYIRRECKFRTDLHTHMNANLDPDVMIALGIYHQIRYPLYYIKKLGLKCTDEQWEKLLEKRKLIEQGFAGSTLKGKYLTRKIDDNTMINFADLILGNIQDAAFNIPRIRTSLAVMKDGQAVFTNLEKVYLYRYVFAKGTESEEKRSLEGYEEIPDPEIVQTLRQIQKDREDPIYCKNTLFQDKLLWIARNYQNHGIEYAEISDTTLVKREGAVSMLEQVHAVMPRIFEETGVRIRFLAAIRRIPLTIMKDQIAARDYVRENLQVLQAVAVDPYVAGSDIVGEEINDIRELKPLIRELVRIAATTDPTFVIRIHAGENDSLRDNVANSIRCVKDSLSPGQKMPHMRIGHGLYTANLKSRKGQQLMREIRENDVMLEFQITSNVRLNNLSRLDKHPLKSYLHAGIWCVQGTDGGALYGTDSIDEELSLEKMLDLSFDDLVQMCRAEEHYLGIAREAFASKSEKLDKMLEEQQMTLSQLLTARIREGEPADEKLLSAGKKLDSTTAFEGRIEALPAKGIPVILVGGSYNNDSHVTRMRPEECAMIDEILEGSDPEKVFFVIGHRLKGFEKYLLEKCRNRFAVYAFVPSVVTVQEQRALLNTDVRIRVSIEQSGMGLYKSLAYEIFKRRPSVLMAFDGNSAGMNMIQEAKNGKRKCRIFVSGHSRILRMKALSLEGYVTIFDDEKQATKEILAAMEETWESWDPKDLRQEGV